MPFKYVCGKCKEVLYEMLYEVLRKPHAVNPVGYTIKSIDDVIKLHDGKCPKCGKELVKDVSKIEINGYGGARGSTVPGLEKPKASEMADYPAEEQPPVAGKGSPYAGNGPIYTAGKKKGRRKKVWKGI